MISEYIPTVYEWWTGQPFHTFRFDSAPLPFTSTTAAIAICVTYLVTIFSVRLLMRNFEPIKLRYLFSLHNITLCVFSLILAIALVENLYPQWMRHPPHDKPDDGSNGLFYSICSRKAFTQKLEFLYYINYLTKVWELLDTLFLVLRKKKLEFLHVYHHAATFLLCFSQLEGRTSVSWVPILLNLIVHVVMYYYYFLASLGKRVWWKKYVTVFQITQFIIDLGFVYYCSYTYAVSAYNWSLPNHGTCQGTPMAASIGCIILSSYLGLFVQFFGKTYGKRKSPTRVGHTVAEKSRNKLPTKHLTGRTHKRSTNNDDDTSAHVNGTGRMTNGMKRSGSRKLD